MVDRRTLFQGAGVAAAGVALSATATGTAGAAPVPQAVAAAGPSVYRDPAGPRSRVLIVNDTGGDPDGLFSTAHALLCSSTEVRGIVATLHSNGRIPSPADLSATKAKELLKVMGFPKIPVHVGSNTKMTSRTIPIDTPGARAIIAEAKRTDTTLPLYVTVGGNLTEVASAYLLDPTIAGTFTVIWIGGGSYPDGGPEYNLDQDPIAAQVVFNDTSIPIWQVNQDAYRQAVVSDTELQAAMLGCGKVGQYLWNELYTNTIVAYSRYINLGETYVLGDSPLVLLSALNQAYDSTGASGTGTSLFDTVPAPVLGATGSYTENPDGRPIRVYRTIDTRLMFNDFFAKMLFRYGKH
ncbi:nucleoside hydrolase [Nakamurella sp. YIM 132087]|uniref:Nucleoside hydrolase n=1 Tax=Nakamurella alba TaxID=2665158 RepID=A0A7K1FQ60_9ACTN|nr:nucleoside hydrolase [Nakamurella alba]MTD16285.1 nucleoside hydrolase [Nakamurella alba]